MEDLKLSHQAALKRLEKFSRFTDSSLKIPFTNFKVGADAIIGLLPVAGDMAGFILSAYALIEVQRLGVSLDYKTTYIS